MNELVMHQGTTMIYRDTFEDINCCSRYGFDAIDLKYNIIKEISPSKLLKHLWSKNIRVNSISAVKIPWNVDEIEKNFFYNRMQNILDCADYIGANNIIANVILDDSPIDFFVKKIERELDYIDGIASKKSIGISIEITGNSRIMKAPLSEMACIINKNEYDNISMVYDIFQALGYGNFTDILIDSVVNNLSAVHLNDGKKRYNESYRDDDRCWPGEGDAEVGSQISFLKEKGYLGPFSIEVFEREGWKFSIEHCYKKAKYFYEKCI